MSSEKVASTVVTSETRHEFMSKKLNLEPTVPLADIAKGDDAPGPGGDGKDNPKAEEAKQGTEADVKQEKVEEKEVKKEEPDDKEKKKNALNQRFSELAHERDEAKRLAEEERKKSELHERKIRELEDQLRPKVPDQIGAEPDAPKIEEYQNDVQAFYKAMSEYTKKHSEWSVKKAFHDKEVKDLKERSDREATRFAAQWAQNVTKAKTEFDDFDDTVTNTSVRVSKEIENEIFRSDIGPYLVYHIAKHPEVAEELASLPLASAIKKIGKLEAKMENELEIKRKPKQKEPEPEVKEAPKVEVSKAPPPINPLKGGNAAPDVPIDSRGEFTGTHKQFQEWRKAGKLK